jgi:sugar phosphate isomerase/epimerase
VTAKPDSAGFPLVASYWTIAGNARLRMFGGTDYSPLDLRERIEAAAAAGYAGIGLHSYDLQHWSSRYPSAVVARLLADNGLRYVELEILREWFSDGERRRESDKTRQVLLTLAAELPVTHVKAGSSFAPDRWPVEHIAEEFAALCAQFAETGAKVGIEPIPNAYLRTPPEVLEVLDLAGAPNGGLILDTWHTFRAGYPYERLSDIPGEKIVSIEIADGAAEPVVDLANDGCNHRRLPGEGAFRVTEWADAILATGYRGHIGVENLSAENRGRGLPEQARQNFAAAVRELTPLAGKYARNLAA